MSNITQLRGNKPTARELLAGIKVIDVDTHISEWPTLWTDRAPLHLKALMPRVVGEGDAYRWVIGEDATIYDNGASCSVMKDGSKKKLGAKFRGTTHKDITPAAYDVSARLEMMGEQGIYAQVAYPNILGFAGKQAMKTDSELRLLSIRIFNDAMGEVQKESRDRILPMVLVPWWDVDESIMEIERCLKWGIRGINFYPDPHIHGLPAISDPHWNRVWEACIANKLPVHFHIGASDLSAPWTYEDGLPTFNTDQKAAMAMLGFLFTNVRVIGNILVSRFLEQWPELKIVSVESGAGWIPYLLEGLEYTSADSDINYAVPIKEIFRRQIYACVFFERSNLIGTMRLLGADNIMFESDFPHPACIYPNAMEYMIDAIIEMTQEERFKVFSGNAAKLYKIDIS